MATPPSSVPYDKIYSEHHKIQQKDAIISTVETLLISLYKKNKDNDVQCKEVQEILCQYMGTCLEELLKIIKRTPAKDIISTSETGYCGMQFVLAFLLKQKEDEKPDMTLFSNIETNVVDYFQKNKMHINQDIIYGLLCMERNNSFLYEKTNDSYYILYLRTFNAVIQDSVLHGKILALLYEKLDMETMYYYADEKTLSGYDNDQEKQILHREIMNIQVLEKGPVKPTDTSTDIFTVIEENIYHDGKYIDDYFKSCSKEPTKCNIIFKIHISILTLFNSIDKYKNSIEYFKNIKLKNLISTWECKYLKFTKFESIASTLYTVLNKEQYVTAPMSCLFIKLKMMIMRYKCLSQKRHHTIIDDMIMKFEIFYGKRKALAKNK